MKKLFLFISILSISCIGYAQIFNEDFGTTGGGPYATANTTLINQCGGDGVDNSDYFGVVLAADINQTYTGGSGAFLAAQDIDGTPCTTGTGGVTISGINIAGETNIVVCFDIAEGTAGDGNEDWDATSAVTVAADIDASGAPQTLYTATGGGATNTAPGADCDGDGVTDGTPITDTFTTFCIPVTGTGNSLEITISISGLDAGDEDVAFDNIAVYSDNSPAPNTDTGCSTPVVFGCIDMSACNFDSGATADDGSCFYVGDTCDDADPGTIGESIQADCSCGGGTTGLSSCGIPAWEAVSVTDNTDVDVWTAITGGFNMNGFCGGGCAEQIDQWLVYGPLDMSSVSTLQLLFDAAENFGTTDLNIYYTADYSSGCPSSATWTNAGTITDAGPQNIDLSAAAGALVYIAIEYSDDGADGYSNWDLTNFDIIADACPTVGTPIVSDCSGGTTFDCPTEMVNFGDACDDMDAMTTGDVIQMDCTCAGTPSGGGSCPASAKINEFHYDNASGDLNEFIEVALPAGSDPTQIQIDLYNGSNGASYDSIILSAGEFVSTDGTLDYYVWSPGSIQNGNDGIATSCIDGTQYMFITYEGAFMATDGPFAGVMGVDVGVEETGATTEFQSIMCDGTGNYLTDCAADAGAANDLTTCGVITFDCPTEMVNFGDACDDMDATTTNDVIQNDCTCAGVVPMFDCPTEMVNFGDSCDDGDMMTTGDVIQNDCTCAGTPSGGGSCPASAKINEFHYDNVGGDLNTFIEIALPAGSDPTQIQVDLYNGSNGTSYNSIILSAGEFVSTDGTLDYYVWTGVDPQNGNDGIATSCIDGTQYMFITYEGAFMATDGPFAGAMGVDVGVSEDGGTTTDTQSIMCDGTGTYLTNCTADAGAANDLTTCGSITFDCPTEMVNFGDSCTDSNGNPSTIGMDCTCTVVATCDAAAGVLELPDGSTSMTICINDGIDEPADIQVIDAGAGNNGAWVITDASGIILDLPLAAPPFTLDGAGAGTCLIWWLTWDGNLSATPAIGDDAAALVAASDCAFLSNPITVIREVCVGPDCEADYGTFPAE